MTYAELARAVSAAAQSFRRAGLVAGDHVALSLSNQTQYLVSSLALASIGVGQLALRSGDPPEVVRELAGRLKIVGTVTGTRAAVAGSRIEPPPPGIEQLRALREPILQPVADGSLPFLLKRSSGTARALVKISILTHAMGVPPAQAFPKELPLGAGCRFLSFSPLHFATAMNHVPRVLCNGSCLVLADGIAEPGEMVEFIKRQRINFAAGGPTHAVALLKAAQPGRMLLPELALRISSTFVHEEVRTAIQQRLTPQIYISYSTTETGGLSAAGPAQVGRHAGTVGYAFPGVELEVVDEQGAPAGVGEVGRLRARTPWMVRGYVDDPEETQRAFRDGWFDTKDLVEMRADGELIHHGRADDVMIYDGMNIEPAEIEGVLLRHPAVADAAAFGIPSKIRGALPAAAVVLARRCPVDELHRHCAESLGLRAPVKIFVVPSLPRNAMGKVLRRELVNLYVP